MLHCLIQHQTLLRRSQAECFCSGYTGHTGLVLTAGAGVILVLVDRAGISMDTAENGESALNEHVQTPVKDRLFFWVLDSQALANVATVGTVSAGLAFLLSED